LSEAARSLVHLFLAKRLSSKVPDVSPTVKPSALRRFGVVGGGLMGVGIAAALVMAGAEKVVIKEAEPKFLEAAKQRVASLFQGRLKRGALTQAQYDRIVNQVVQLTLTYEDFRNVDCAIEAVFENVPLKQQIFVDLEKYCPKHALLATNTSTIDIDLIGAKTRAQERIIGLHFFSPAHVMPLLEIVRPRATAPQAVVDSLALSTAMRKTPIVVGVCPGFTVNRIFFPYFQSAMFLVDVGALKLACSASLLSLTTHRHRSLPHRQGADQVWPADGRFPSR
jgi:enoyl-CoA hydratase/3-hydroxyacyl-CoA dehydrogenase